MAVALVLLSAPHTASAQAESTADSLVTISLTDGTSITGSIVAEDDDNLQIVTPAGLQVTVPRASIVAIKPVQGKVVQGVLQRYDPSYSRLIFAPTGRPLAAGEGYFSNYYVFFPGITYGLTDHVSITGGVSLLPGLSLGDQLVTLAPRVGLRVSDQLAVSAGTLFMTVAGEGSVGIAFATGSFGGQDRSLTVGLGYGYTKEKGEDVDFAQYPILMFGGNLRLSNSVALVSENWLITGKGGGLGEQPFAAALRFFGERIAVDVGAIVIGEVIKEGVPIPWLSFVYHFGHG